MGYIMGMYPDSSAAIDALYERYPLMSDNDTDVRTIATTQATTDWWFGSGSSQEAHLHGRYCTTTDVTEDYLLKVSC